AQCHESLVERFRDRPPACELVIGDGIDTRRRSKRIDDDRDVDVLRCRRTNSVVVELPRAGENVRLSCVIAVEIEYEVLHRFVSVRKPCTGGDVLAVEKRSVHNPVKSRLVNSAIVGGGQARAHPQTAAFVYLVSRGELIKRTCRGRLIKVGVVFPAHEDARIEHPRAQRQAFLVFTGWRNLLRRRTRRGPHSQCQSKEYASVQLPATDPHSCDPTGPSEKRIKIQWY